MITADKSRAVKLVMSDMSEILVNIMWWLAAWSLSPGHLLSISGSLAQVVTWSKMVIELAKSLTWLPWSHKMPLHVVAWCTFLYYFFLFKEASLLDRPWCDSCLAFIDGWRLQRYLLGRKKTLFWMACWTCYKSSRTLEYFMPTVPCSMEWHINLW